MNRYTTFFLFIFIFFYQAHAPTHAYYIQGICIIHGGDHVRRETFDHRRNRSRNTVRVRRGRLTTASNNIIVYLIVSYYNILLCTVVYRVIIIIIKVLKRYQIESGGDFSSVRVYVPKIEIETRVMYTHTRRVYAVKKRITLETFTVSNCFFPTSKRGERKLFYFFFNLSLPRFL